MMNNAYLFKEILPISCDVAMVFVAAVLKDSNL